MKHCLFDRIKRSSRYGLVRKRLIIEEYRRHWSVSILSWKYGIPKSTLYKILNEWYDGKIPSLNDLLELSDNNGLSKEEKSFILQHVIPPSYPVTIDRFNKMLNDEFGQKERKRDI